MIKMKEKDRMNTEKKEKIICIGAGASGLFFALNCADDDHEVILIDGNAKAGRKMYISGKGRCNITNDCEVKEFINNVIRNPRFLYSAINRFKPVDTIAFFNEHECPLKTERGNRVFPVSDKSADIIDTLVRECRRKKVKLIFEEKAEKIEKTTEGFTVRCTDNEYTCNRLVIATGGLSYPSTGSTGDGYEFARSFGHNIVELKSALCPLRIREKINKDMYDLTLRNVTLTAANDHFRKSIFGDLEFLPGAITGPIALSMSSLINREENIKLTLDLKPALDEEKLDRRLLRDIEKDPNKDVRFLLKGLLPEGFIRFFLDNTATDPSIILNSMTKVMRKQLLNDLKHFRFDYISPESIDKGIVTSGGVDVKQIDPKTMESKLCEGLYFIGEVLDVDAFTGGFNLQIALSTAYSCAMGIKDQ
jgi:hypothetical protein